MRFVNGFSQPPKSVSILQYCINTFNKYESAMIVSGVCTGFRRMYLIIYLYHKSYIHYNLIAVSRGL